MADTAPPTSLAQQTLARLRKIADGNGLAPDAVQLVSAEENTYLIEGEVRLVPKCERHGGKYPGPVRGKDRRMLDSFGALQSEAGRLEKEFYESKDWLPKAIEELKAIPGYGWGQDGAQITFPEKSVVLAASEPCSACQGRQLITCQQCNGQGTVVCSHCGGRGSETCYNCMGRGTNPVQPDQPCPVCQGRQFTQCRFCHGSTKLACPTCQGRGGTACPNCNGSGRITEELGVAFMVEAHFKLGSGTSLPTGLRRAMDRIGVPNLSKGHADIELIEPEPEEKKPEGAPEQLGTASSAEQTVLQYKVKLPYADLKLQFGNKKVMTAVFGKRGLMFGMPAFLDDALQPWRKRLQQATRGRATFDSILEARIMRDALALELSGRGTINDLRKHYPVGLSPDCAKEILANMALALKRFTLRTRLMAAIACFALSTGVLAGFFLTPLHAHLTQGWPRSAEMALDFILPVLIMALSWVGLNKSIQSILQRHFPKFKIALQQKIGHIGYAMLAATGFAYLLLLALAPMQPTWFIRLAAAIMGKLGH